MKKMKKITVFLITIILFFTIATNVNAVVNAGLKSTKERVNIGEEIIVSLDLNLDNKEETSLYAYTAKLSYDKDVFEVIDESNFEENEDWSDITYNKSNNKFALINKKGKVNEKILQIKLKVKDNAIPGNTTIAVNSITASDGKKDIQLESKTVDVMVTKNGLEEGGNIPVNKTNEIVENTTSIEIGKGHSWISYVLIAISIVMFMFLIYYFRKSQEANTPKGRRIKIIIVLNLIIVALIIVTIILKSNKKADVNNDGQVNYSDSKEIIEYLLEIKKTEEDEKLNEKDINKDGKITIGDVAVTTKQATNQNYSVNGPSDNGNTSENTNNPSDPNNPNSPSNPNESTKPEEQYFSVKGSRYTNEAGETIQYATKGQNIKIIYIIESNIAETITSFTVNGTKIPASKNADGTYTVLYTAPSYAGKIGIEVTGVTFETSGDIATNHYTSVLEVLKYVKPVVSGISVVNTNNKPVLAFVLTDEEDTFVKGKVVITNSENPEDKQEIEFDDISKIPFELQNIKYSTTYTVDVYITYDFDSDKTSKDNQVENELLAHGEFELLGTISEFTLTNLEVKSIDRANNVAVLQFTSTLQAEGDYFVDKVVINSVTYDDVNRDGTTYTVEVPYTELKRQELVLQEAILNNSQGFAITDQSVLIFKTEPKALVQSTSAVHELLEGQKNITAEIKIEDPDNTILKGTLHARLLDPEGKEVATQDKIIDKDVLHEEITNLNFEQQTTYKAGTYTIEVYADYDRVDGVKYNKTAIGNGKATVGIYATIVNANVNKQYVNKNESFEIEYKVNSNSQEKPKEIIVNTETLSITIKEEPDENGTYTITVTAIAPEKAGIATYSATRLVYENQQVSTTKDVTVDVLKNTKPVVTELKVDDTNASEPELSFNITDEEDTFVSGKVIVTDEVGTETEYQIKSKTETTFKLENIVKLRTYNVSVEITYDLDSDHKNTDNQTTEEVSKGQFRIISDYDFKISNYQIESVNKEKGVITIKFESSNKVDIPVKTVIINESEYSITSQEDDIYTVELKYEDTQRKELELQKVILDNLKEFTELNLEKVIAFKTVPQATIQAHAEDMTTIKATFNVIDPEYIVEKIYVKLLDKNGAEIDGQEFDKNTTISEVRFTAEDGVFKEGTYKVQVLADYDAVNGESTKPGILETADVNIAMYSYKVESAVQNYYVAKNEEIKITYTIETNTEKEIQSLVVNGEPQTPEKTPDGKYVLTYTTPENYGVYNYNLTEIVYGEEDKLTVSDTASIDVLKDKVPVVDGLALNTDGDTPQLTFVVTDEEETFVSGKVVITDEDGVEEVYTFETLEGLSFDLKNIKKFVKYNAKVYITYDFDSDKIDTENQKQNELLKENEFELREDYNFTLTNVHLKEIAKDKNAIILEFDSTLAEEAVDDIYLDKVMINGSAYTVKKEGDKYTVEIPYTDENRKEIKIEKAILNNLQQFDVTVEPIVVFKKVSAIVMPSVLENKKGISVSTTVTDDDKIAENIYVVLIDESGKEVERKQTERGDTIVTFEKAEVLEAGNYTVQVIATYDAVDGLGKQQDKVLVEGQIKVSPLVEIVNADCEQYVTKGKEFDVTYTLNTNSNIEVRSIVINEKVCDATKLGENKYKAKVIAPQKAGKLNLNVTKIKLQNDDVIETTYTSKTEVLKSVAPTISNVVVDDTQSLPVLTFNITDEEETFVNGTIIVTDTKTGVVKEIPFTSTGTTSYELEGIEKFRKYKLEIKVTYDFDLDKVNTENQHTVSAERKFEIIGEYNFKLDKLKVKEIKKDTKTAVLEFESTNASQDTDEHEDYYVDTVTINGETYEDVVKTGTTYTVDVHYDKEERKVLTLQSAKLNNLKEFTELARSVVIFKDAPTAEVTATVSEDLTTITGKLVLTDKDTTLQSLNARLVNPDGSPIKTADINNDATTVSFTSPEEGTFRAGEYRIVIGADFDRVDGEVNNKKEQIGEGITKVPTKASITKADVINYYAEKGQSLQIKYTLTSNNTKNLTGLNIDNTYYPATYNEDGTYTVSIQVPNTNYGIATITPTIAIYDNETVKLDETQTADYYILKSAPHISDYAFNHKTKDQTITFNLNDEESAIVDDAYVLVGNEENGELIKQKLNTQTNTVKLNELPNGTYTVRLEGKYDLDDDRSNGENEHNLADIFTTEPIQVTSDYKAKINVTDVTIEKGSNEAVVKFTSTNTSGLDVKSIVVDGKTYPAEKQTDGSYIAKIKYEKEQNQTFEITGMVIGDEIEVDLAESKKVQIFKQEPKVTNVATQVNGSTVNVTFTVEDEAGIMENAKAILKDSSGNTVGEPKDVVKGIDGNVTVTFENVTKAGEYTIEIVADYDCVDGDVHKGEKLNKDEIKAILGITATIKMEKIATKDGTTVEYINKGDELQITYNITSNTEEPITALVIDGDECEVEKEGESYKATVTAPLECGNKTFEVTGIKYGKNVIAVENSDAHVYVLKQTPTITDYNLNIDTKTITFIVTNIDKAIINAKAKILDSNNSEILTQDIVNETNTLELQSYNLDDIAIYKLIIEGTYDLDDTADDSKNSHDIAELFGEESFQLKIETEIISSEFSTRYPEKGKDVEITYEITSNTQIPIRKIFINDAPYEAEKLEGNKYKVTYTASSNFGIQELKVNKVAHGENVIEIAEEYTKQIDVLKSMPGVKNYSVDDNWENKTVTFKFTIVDPDGAIEKNDDGSYKISATFGNCELVDSDKDKKLIVGENEITYKNVPENKIFMMDLVAEYDRDTDTLNSELSGTDDNTNNGRALLRMAGFLVQPTVLHIQNIKALKLDEANTPVNYLEKNESFKLSFTADTYQGELDGKQNIYYPVSAMINGQSYELERKENTYTTKTALTGYGSCGIQTITIDTITLNNNEVIESVKQNCEVDVLKDKLRIENFTVDTLSGEAIAKFTMTDTESSFVSGNIILTNTTNQEETKVALANDRNEYLLTVEEGVKYTAQLKIKYDLDSKPEDTQNQKEETFGDAVEFELIKNYELSISDCIVTSIDKERHTATIQFRSTNVTNHKLKSVKVGEREYAVEETGEAYSNTYTFECELDENTFGQRTEITISSVKLDNGAEVEINENNTVVIFKTRPVVDNLQLQIENNNNIKVTFDLTDKEQTLSDLYVILKDEKDNLISEQKIDNEVKEYTFEKLLANNYKVIIAGDFDIVDGERHEKDELKTSEITEIKPTVDIVTKSISNKYPEKGTNIDFVYTITSNTSSNVSKITLKGQEYEVALEEGTQFDYKISNVRVSENAGLDDYNITRIEFADGQSVDITDTPHKDAIDVLKTKPTVSITSLDDIEKRKVLFTIEVKDPDNAIDSGIASVHESKVDITKGTGTYSLLVEVEPDTEHILNVTVNYDLDTDSLKTDTDVDDNTSTIVESKTFTLVSNYDLKITNLRTLKKESKVQTTYFAKNETILLWFNCTNSATLKPEKVIINDLKNSASDGNWYDVQEAESGTSEYYVELNAGSNSGTYEYEIAQIQLQSSRIIEKSKFEGGSPTAKVEVLKDKPKIENYNVANEGNVVTITFDLVDPDGALEDESYVKIENATTKQVVKQYKITKESNKHVFSDLTPGTKYTIKIENNYNLNVETQEAANKGNELFKDEPLEITKQDEPNFIAKKLNVPKRVPNGQKVLLSFENEVMSYKDVDTVTVDGKDYGISKDSDGVYRLELDPGDVGVRTINVESVKIGEKVFKINRPLTYTHEYIIPTAINVSDINEDASVNSAIVTYTIQDPHECVKKLKAYMTNSAGVVVATKEVESETQLDMPLLKSNKYGIELKAECDIGDGKTFEEKSLFVKAKYTPSRVTIISQDSDKEYAKKGEEVVLTFKINTNCDSEIKKFYIGDDSYTVSKVKDEEDKIIEDTYQITVKSPNKGRSLPTRYIKSTNRQ